MSGHQNINKEILLKRINELLEQGNEVLKSQFNITTSHNPNRYPVGSYVSLALQNGFRASSLSFIKNLYGETHPFYKEFDKGTDINRLCEAKSGIQILKSIKDEIENDWLVSFKQLISAEIFSDFFEMAKYLLDEGYKDPAAVMIGSLLEEHLRLLCKNHSIEIVIDKDGDLIPKKANRLNDDLTKAGIYGTLDQKSVSAWLDLRNKAAHGKYDQYTKGQVDMMHDGVLDFVRRCQ